MKVENETFYVVQTPGDDRVLGSEEDAIGHLKSNGSDVDPESDDLSVVEVSYAGDDWTIKELPWQRIALQLLQEGR